MRFDCPSCGRTLNVKDEYAGKKARCPGCKEVLTVPFAPEAAAPQPAAAASACPSCGARLSEGAVLCVSCGYDLRTGQKLQTVTGGAPEEDEAGDDPDDDEAEGYSRDERA
jgi:hypothetical protein